MQKSLSGGVVTCSYAMDYESDTEMTAEHLGGIQADLNRTSCIGQAGNAMHSNCVGLVLGFILTQSRKPSVNSHQAAMRQTHAQIGQVGGVTRSSTLNLIASMVLGKPLP